MLNILTNYLPSTLNNILITKICIKPTEMTPLIEYVFLQGTVGIIMNQYCDKGKLSLGLFNRAIEFSIVIARRYGCTGC